MKGKMRRSISLLLVLAMAMSLLGGSAWAAEAAEADSAAPVTINKAATVSTTIKKLTKGKKYYVRIRTYQKVSGKTYYSAWSASKNVTIKK